MKKEENHFPKILLVGLITTLLCLAGCYVYKVSQEAAPVSPPPAETPVFVETPQAPAEITVVPASSEYISNIVCHEKSVSVVVTNIGSYPWDITQKANFYLNGGWDKTPECDKGILAVGESMTCTGIDFPVVYRNNKKNVLQINAHGQKQLVPFYCP